MASATSPLLTDTGDGTTPDNALPPKTVILTFDDGPNGPPSSATPDMTIAIAQYLASENIHAVFFVNGRRFLGQSLNPVSGCGLFDSGNVPGVGHASGPFTPQYAESVLDTLVSLGHRVANHTQDHCNLTGGNDTFLDAELLPTQAIVDRHAKNGPFLFRPPYGSWDVPTDSANAQADGCLDKLDGPVQWDVDGGDWGCWQPHFEPNDPNPWPQGDVSACLNQYLRTGDKPLFDRAQRNGVFLHHDRPEPAVATADMYGPNLQGANHYTAHTVTVQNEDGSSTTLPGTYPSNELGYIKAEVTYLKSQGYSFGRIEDLYDSGRARVWSTAQSCASSSPAAALDYSDGDSAFGSSPGYYGSIGLADVNGDGYADACARFGGGIECATNRGNGQFNAHTTWFGSNFLDAYGWNPAQYGSTIQFRDLNGDGRADVCGRGGAGIYCAASSGSSFGQFGLATLGNDFSDNGVWYSAAAYYGSIHYGDVNGDHVPDVCGRSDAGVVCALNVSAWGGPVRFSSASLWTSQYSDTDWADWTPWSSDAYGATVQLGDVNGDGKADVCGREAFGIRCSLSTGQGFAAATMWTTWPDFSDGDSTADNWQDSYYYKSIRLVDINADGKADVCGRTSNGIVCAFSNGSSFSRYQVMTFPRETVVGSPEATTGNDFTDGLGWGADPYGSTIQFGDLDGDGRADVCGRGGAGLLCALSPQPCASFSTVGDVFSPGMVGCTGRVTWEQSASLCGPRFHPCTASQWIAQHGSAAPTHNYWTAERLNYAGSGTGTCAVSGSSTGFYSCAANGTAEPMRVCTSSGTDAENNLCNWTHCGFGANTPDEYFGGCYNNQYAGTLCCGQ